MEKTDGGVNADIAAMTSEDWMRVMNERRIGKWTVPGGLANEQPKLLHDSQRRCLIIQSQHVFHIDEVSYYGYSPDFEPVPMGQLIPSYQAALYEEQGQILAVKFERQP